ncbi:phage/plasmid primase, P4 family [Clostridium saccharobutylicum]|uniref:SF3 helicase domain-containing protein n=1 Tax=Clostridium saccharobutylicum TaxID=169679 RepID=A0A1S8NK39_CLOSA|nr:phage/plasmid primase, P4 family [Clostridium saccharobutylicum]OOM16752.1 hypothetical protein CLOSAC_10460 [Clostridium saccharobutylicum]
MDLNIREIISTHGLLPVVPLTGYSKKPFCQWSKKETWIKNIDECNIKKFSWINKENQQKQGSVTGFSLLLGKKSNITVIDLDIGHSDDVNGINSFKEIIKVLPKEDIEIIKSTFTTQTPRGGYHLYFKYVEGIKGIADYFKDIGKPGIDVRAEGNLVPIPGTKIQLNGQGKAITYSIKNNSEIKPMPQSLIDLFKQHQNKPVNKINNTKNFTKSKYYKVINEGEGRDNTLFSWLGSITKFNPNLRSRNELIPLAEMYNLRYLYPPLDSKTIIEKVDSILKYADPIYINEKGKVIPYELAKFISTKNIVISDSLNSYIYHDNYYKEVENDFYSEIDKLVDNKELIKMNMVNEVAEQIKKQNNMSVIENARGYINFKNGILDLKNKKLVPHTQEIVTLGQINGNYIQKKSDITGTRFEKFLNTSLTSDLIPVVQEMLGVCLYPLTDKVSYFYFLTGEGRNGKGILLDIILNIIPSNFRSGISIKDYDTRFSNSSIKGKSINICTDDPTTRLEGVGNLKAVTAGEGIFVEKKGKDGIMIKAILTHISAINDLPSMQEKTNALFDRMIVIPFNKTFGTKEEVDLGEKDMLKDPNLKTDIINNELDIIIAWAIVGLFRVIDNNFEFTICNTIKEKKEEYREDVDSVRQWAKLHYRAITPTCNEDYIKGSMLLNIYKAWCLKEGVKEVGRNSFYKSMNRLFKAQLKEIHKQQYYAIKLTRSYSSPFEDIKTFEVKESKAIQQEILPKEPVTGLGWNMK